MTVTVKVKPSDLVEQFIQLRNQMKKDEAEFAAYRKEEYDEPMEKLSGQLLQILNDLGQDAMRSKSGEIHKIRNTSVTIADGGQFRRHVIGLEAWDLADWRANKTRINEMVEAGEPLPPGIKRNVFITLGVRGGKDT